MSEPLEMLEAIRRRPAMYVGSMDLAGLVRYLVFPVAILLGHGAKRLDVTVNDGFEIGSDAVIAVEQTDDGRIAPFQEMGRYGIGHGWEATVMTALSEQLTVSVDTGIQLQKMTFSRGDLESYISAESTGGLRGTTLRLKPDSTIFTVTELSPAFFTSYLRRLSYLHAGVRFTLTVGGDRQEFFAENGTDEFFNAISVPYQLMHEPIHFAAREGSLDLEVVMAYHSCKDHLCSFINNGRPVGGGTHEQGLTQGLKRLKEKLDLPEDFNNGVVAISSLRYPRAVWEGTARHKISNPELKTMVSRLVVSEVVVWLEKHPDVEAQIRQLQTFTPPDA